MLGPYDFKPSHFGETILAIARGKLPALVDAGLCWVDIRDVAKGMITAAERANAGSKYLLTGPWVSLTDIARQVCQAAGARTPRLVLPLWLARAVAPAAEYTDRARGKRPTFTPIAMKELESNPVISFEKAAKDFGYAPRPMSETIPETIEWFRANGYLEPKTRR